MATAYTSLVSLMNTVDSIQNHPRHSFSFDKKLIGYLRTKSRFFLEFIDIHNFDHGRSKEVEDLEIEIASAARLAEDVLESCVADQIIVGRTVDDESEEFSHALQTIMKAVSKTKSIKVSEKIRPKLQSMSNFPMLKILIDSLVKKVCKIKKEESSEQSRDLMADASSRPLTTARTSNSMVGFDDHLIQLMDLLTGHQSSRQIISVVGMGGIGKTTLARNVYEHMVIVEHFYIRAWATISQEENIKEILLELLSRRGESTRDTVDDLGEELYKKLSGSRYLIVLDDMWSCRVWDRIRFFFPDNGSRSRIVVTTRLSYVASYVSISSLEMDILDEDKSWTLFCAKTFGDEGEDCPVELEETGKKIVEQCKGLPLSIVLIAGHLRKLSRTETQWMNVARSMISFLNSDEDECLSILSLSYSHLPAHLKPCFLYMGTFPEDKEILVSTLIRLWVAEGFLRSDGARSLEEIAQGYLKDLVEGILYPLIRNKVLAENF